jgi:hypothetical protein
MEAVRCVNPHHRKDPSYSPLLADLAQTGQILRLRNQPGNVHSADGWEEVRLPVSDRSRARGQTVIVRADAALALPALSEALERRGVAYAVRFPAKDVLERVIEDLRARPRGRPRHPRWSATGASRLRPPPVTGRGG